MRQVVYSRRNLKAIAKRWDARAATWDQALEDPHCHLNEDDAYRRFIRAVLRIVANRRRFCATHGVIDAGCGTGLVLGAVIPAFAWGIGVDISTKMIRAARGKDIAGASFVVGDCFDLPTICPKAGAVLSRGVLLSHYGPKQGELTLRAARTVLMPGGFVLFDFLNKFAQSRYRHAPENKTWFNAGDIRDIARRAGFSKVKILGDPSRRVGLLLAKT
jgi:SAM-dependent methyltransferase